MEHVIHTFPPVADRESRVLVLGTFPSVKSRENRFYYGHPQNRFWKLLALLTQEEVPVSAEEKKALLLAHHIAVWDVIASCDITGSSDSSIRNVKENDVAGLLQKTPIDRIYANGGKAFALYEKYCRPRTGRPITKLPSTSPANAAWSLEALAEVWKVILQP